MAIEGAGATATEMSSQVQTQHSNETTDRLRKRHLDLISPSALGLGLTSLFEAGLKAKLRAGAELMTSVSNLGTSRVATVDGSLLLTFFSELSTVIGERNVNESFCT